jgi:hypothetical protein
MPLESVGAAEQSLAADGAIACFSSNFFQLSLNADRAPQLKAVVRWLRLMNQAKEEECECFKTA